MAPTVARNALDVRLTLALRRRPLGATHGRVLFVAIRNLVALALLLLSLPSRLMRRDRRPAWIRFRLKGDVPYRPPARRLRFRRRDPAAVGSVEELAARLEVLAADERVRGVVLEIESFASPPAKREAIAAHLEAFRQKGKQVVGWAVSADNAAYELLCACDRIALAPAGRLDVMGFAAEATALGELLRRVGVRAQFLRRGEHKTAPELFTHDRPSDIQLETIGAILDERYDELVSIIARGRKLTRREAAARIDEGPYSARRAFAAGLVDALVGPPDLGRYLHDPASWKAEDEGRPEERVKSFAEYARSCLLPPFWFRPMRRRERVSVVPISGVIVHGVGPAVPMGPPVASSEAVVRALEAAARSRSRAVVLYISSPGGSAVGSELILEEARRLAKKKPTVAYFDRVAASGGYMAALGASEIWAAKHAIAGSIGVFAGKFDFSGLLERLGVKRAIVARGENAAAFSLSRAFTEHERATLERDIEDTYQAFLEHVARARRKPVDEVHELAEGRVYSGRAALEKGLVDRTGLFEDACRRALELAGRPAERFELLVHGPLRRRLPLVSLLRSFSAFGVWALWYPWLDVPGSRGAEPF